MLFHIQHSFSSRCQRVNFIQLAYTRSHPINNITELCKHTWQNWIHASEWVKENNRNQSIHFNGINKMQRVLKIQTQQLIKQTNTLFYNHSLFDDDIFLLSHNILCTVFIKYLKDLKSPRYMTNYFHLISIDKFNIYFLTTTL